MRNALQGKIRSIALRGVVLRGGQKTVQVETLSGDPLEARVFHPYGLSSFLGRGADGAVLSLGGSSASGAMVGAGDMAREPVLKEWEVAVWSRHGQIILLGADGQVLVNTTVKAAMIEDAVGSLDQLRQYVMLHTHTSAAPGSPTSPPVQPAPWGAA
jgi:phage gp45-like